jgi:hypothetical protein
MCIGVWDIELPHHLLPSAFQKPISHANSDPTSTEEDQDSDDSRPLAKVMKGNRKRTVMEPAGVCSRSFDESGG